MGKRKNQLSLVLMLALLALTLWVVFRDQSPQALRDALTRARPGWLVLGLGLMAGFIGLEALSTKLTLRAMGHRLPYRHCYSFSTAGFYFSSITPSATGGQPAQVFYMTRRGVSAAHGALDMLLISAAYQAATLVMAILSAVIDPGAAAGLGTGLGVLLGYGGAVTLLLTVALVLFLFRPKPAQRVCAFFLRLGARLRLVKDLDASFEKLARQMDEYRRGAKLLRAKPFLFPQLLLLALGQLLCSYLIPWTVYMAFGLTGTGPVRLVAVQALLYLAVSALPIPGAVGASEAAFLAAYRTIFTPALTAPAMLLSRGVSFYLPLLLTGLGTAALHLATRPGEKHSESKSS